MTLKVSGRPDVLATAAAGLSAPAAPALLLMLLGAACSMDTTRACILLQRKAMTSCLQVQLYLVGLGCRPGCAQQHQRDPQLEAGHGVLCDIMHRLLVMLHVWLLSALMQRGGSCCEVMEGARFFEPTQAEQADQGACEVQLIDVDMNGLF